MLPTAPAPGLPVLPELAARFAGAAARTAPEPPGGGAPLCSAAAGYWHRRGLHTAPGQVLAAPGAPPLLLALLSAAGGPPAGAVLLPRPGAAWYAPQARLLGHPVHGVGVPAESGGIPDPVALLETVRRVRAEGGDPRVLLLSVADDPTGTVPPPEPLLEVCEAASAEGLLVVSDETLRDTLHDVRGTVVVSPAEMIPDRVVILTGLDAAYTPPGWPAAVARFPDTGHGARLRRDTRTALAAMSAVLPPPVAEAAALALAEPAPVRARVTASARLSAALAAGLLDALSAAGAEVRPPHAGHQVYADLGPLRSGLAARGVRDSVELEDHLAGRLGEGAVAGGHRFGDELDALRIRLATAPLAGPDDASRLRSLTAADPLASPDVSRALTRFASAITELTGATA